MGEPREFLQAGIELIGVPGAEGDAEVVALTIEALDAAGLRRHRVGVGDGSLYRRLLLALDVPEDGHEPLAGVPLRAATSWAWSCERGRLGVGARASASCSCGCPSCAAAPRCSTARTGRWPRRWRDCAPSTTCSSDRGVADRVIFDLGLVRELGYYTGAVFEVYDPAVGFALGGGGRYDELLGRFGRDLPACGIALDVQRVHLAQAAEEALG